MMRHALAALVIGLSVIAGRSPAAAERLAPGCIPEKSEGLRSVSIRFGGLAPSENIARFYEALRVRNGLPCRTVSLGESQPTVSHALLDKQYRAIPAPYPATMDAVLCKLNAKSCVKGRLVGTTFVVPNVGFNSDFPRWTSLPLAPDEDPGGDLDGVLARRKFSLPSDKDRREWLDRIRKANIGFSRSVTKSIQSQSGARMKQRQLVVPITEYSATIWVPPTIAAIPEKAFGIEDFSFDPVVPLPASVRSNGTSFAPQFEAAFRMISMPAVLPPPRADPSSVLIADRGIDASCVFLYPDRAVPPDVLAAATTGETPACPVAAHGTHVWGIIGGRVPTVMRGVAVVETEALKIESWDFDRQSPDQPNDFFTFVNEAVGSARVANFSFDFQSDLTPSQADRIADMVEHTPSILYVVAAENRLAKYRRAGPFALPVALNAADNVVVVTALNESGTGVWDSAARNNSETDDVILLAAPGIGIPSACAGNRVGVLSGTSQATAFVSGAAALLARDGLEDSLRIKRRLAYTADVLPALVDGVAAGRLNVSRALGVKDDKVCPQAGGDGVSCDAWSVGVARFGHRSATGFAPAKSVVLKRLGGQVVAEVSPAADVLRIAKNPRVAGDEHDPGFTVFYLEADEAQTKRLRRRRVAAVEAFSDRDHHGSLVIHFDEDGVGAKDVPLEELADFVRRGA